MLFPIQLIFKWFSLDLLHSIYEFTKDLAEDADFKMAMGAGAPKNRAKKSKTLVFRHAFRLFDFTSDKNTKLTLLLCSLLKLFPIKQTIETYANILTRKSKLFSWNN